MTPSAEKQALRHTVRAARQALSASIRTRETAATVAQVWTLVQDGTHPLASYLAVRDELDLDELHYRWWSLGRVLWLPRVSGPGTLTWHPLTDLAHTRIGSYGIREPNPDRVPAAPLPTDATVLVPGVGFTRDGHRLGQGQGFYDRVLADHRGHTIGIAFRCQVVATLPTEAHDQRVARVISAAPT
ncbi:MAG TPA: 5-formyltetrahydrofolate cyclo-ligase [Planctomycetota bacterium]|nr:5-formyltetrahydrofolate cyclo-ligase [Planctomycetota bacterium]